MAGLLIAVLCMGFTSFQTNVSFDLFGTKMIEQTSDFVQNRSAITIIFLVILSQNIYLTGQSLDFHLGRLS